MQQTLGRYMPGCWRWLAASVSVWLAFFGALHVRAQESPAANRSQLVAHTVASIVSYTRWPTALGTLQLCVLGPTEYADVLLKGIEPPGERAVLARRVFADEPQTMAGCNALYAGAVPDDEWRSVLARVADQPLLTLSERKALCVVGAMFCLEVRDSSVAFEVNLDSVARSGVRVNPRVLQLGRRKAVP